MRQLLFIFLLTIPTGIFGQNASLTMQGQLIDQISKRPIDLLEVNLDDTIRGRADFEGYFSFENVLPGEHKIQVVTSGQVLVDTTITLTDSKFDITIPIRLNCFKFGEKQALDDIDSGEPSFLLQGGIAPVVYTTDEGFEKKYGITYRDFGCVAPTTRECLIKYNETIEAHLDKKFGRAWRLEVRKDLIK